MADLMRGLIQVKDPLTLFAFLSLVFLVAFRTKKVPELFFGLAKDKLTKERFSQLLHRFMLYGFTGFVLLCISAVAGQVLDFKAQAKPITVEDLRAELKNISRPDTDKQAALNSYSMGLAYVQQRDLDKAIESLQASINQVPTLSAQYTLAYLYQQKGDARNAADHLAAAQVIADNSGDSLAKLRVVQLGASQVAAKSESHGMVGDKRRLPEGGKKPEDAPSISPGLYVSNIALSNNEFRYFKTSIRAGQTLVIDIMTSDTGTYAFASIYDADAILKASDGLMARSNLKSIKWQAPGDTLLYLSIGSEYGNSPNTFYRISIR